MVYLPYMANNGAPYGMTYEIRVAGNPLEHVQTVRDIVRQIDFRLAVFDVKTQSAHIDQLISQEITLARLCTVFAILALGIACVGLYGTVAYNAARRTGEIGIRMALGAGRAGIVWLVLREVFVLGLTGLAIGIPVVLAGSRYVKSFLYGIEPNDPATIALSVVILLATGLAAGYLPAHRASKIDPMVAVRHE
jgi:ABC-type antimicrobial peptide transport system permease subunit